MAYGAAGRTFHYATRSTRLPACHPCARKIKLAPLFHTPPGAIQGALQSIRNVPKHFTGAPVRTSNTKGIQFLPMNLHKGPAAHRYCCRCCVDYFSSIDFFLASIFWGRIKSKLAYAADCCILDFNAICLFANSPLMCCAMRIKEKSRIFLLKLMHNLIAFCIACTC